MNLLETKEFKEIVDLAKKDKNIIALILFGSYAKNNFKENSDLDLCIIKKKDVLPHNFNILNYSDRKKYDILFYDNLDDLVKFKVFSEGKILVLNNKINFLNIRRRFLHKFRDDYSYFEYNMKRLIANV